MKNKQKLDEQQVIARLKEAVSTMRRLPPVRVQGYFNAWPDMVYTEIEIMRMDRKSKTWPATPESISNMEEACGWLNFLSDIDDRKLVWMRSGNAPWEIICKRFGICRSNANKKWKLAIRTITNKHAQLPL